MPKTLSSQTRKRLNIQGLTDVDNEALAPVAPWLRMAFGVDLDGARPPCLGIRVPCTDPLGARPPRNDRGMAILSGLRAGEGIAIGWDN